MSTVLRASPPPQAARPIPRGRPVEGHAPSPLGVSRVALDLHVPTCRRHYPGGPLGLDRSWDGLFQPFPCTQRRRPSPYTCKVGDHIGLFEACSTFTGDYGLSARRVAKATRLSRRLRRFRYLHRRSDSYRLERPSCRVGIAPTEDQHLTVHGAQVWCPCAKKLGKGESSHNVKPFKETLRVTNPVRQSRASSRKRVLRGAGRPSPRSVDSEIKRCVIEPRNYHRREPSSWTLAGAEPGISYTWTHRRAWSHRGRRNMADDRTGFTGTWETLPSPS